MDGIYVMPQTDDISGFKGLISSMVWDFIRSPWIL